MNIYIGLMSGTSMDGIDAALVDVETHQLIAGITRPYSESTLNDLNELCLKQETTLSSLCQLNTRIGTEFALAVEEVISHSGIDKKLIKAIGSHGQTITHDTKASIPYTLQLGCPHTIAEMTKLPVVADFRTRDLVRKGQGAPFAPLYHQAIFANQEESIALVNIGGIANITYLKDEKVHGFDLGPGNCLLDAWIYQCKQETFDKNGEWASSGQVIPELLYSLLADDFFKLLPPKSLGKEYFSLDWLSVHLKKEYRKEDIQATLLALTAQSIAQTLQTNPLPKRLLLCGGGAHNTYLINTLKNLLPELSIASTQTYGISPDFLEAMMFAWLAHKNLNNEMIDLRSITGAKTIGVLGAVYKHVLTN